MRRLFTCALALTLSVAASATTLSPIQLLNPAGSTSGQVIVSTGVSTAPAWGTVPAADLSPIAANTVLANATGSTATPTAVSMPNCVGISSALNYTAGSSYSCNASINALTLSGATFASPGPIGSVSTSTGAFSSISTPSATIGGGTINATSVGATSASTGSFTTLAASSTVSGTGFSNYFASPPNLGLTAPASGKFTTLSTTGAFSPNPTAGIVGTTTNDNANAGSVGEFITSSVTAVSATSNTPLNVTSISLTAGDWEVGGVIAINPAGTTTINTYVFSSNTVSATSDAIPFRTQSNQVQPTAGGYISLPIPIKRYSLSSTTTVYLVSNVIFTTSTLTCDGYIFARRLR